VLNPLALPAVLAIGIRTVPAGKVMGLHQARQGQPVGALPFRRAAVPVDMSRRAFANRAEVRNGNAHLAVWLSVWGGWVVVLGIDDGKTR
jgi:hypothetical protein